jgi:alanine racemase
MTDWVGKPPKHFLDWDLELAATSWYKVELIEAMSRKLGRNIPAHVKFDTGLGRVGIHHSQANEVLTRIARLKHLNVAAIYSHLGYSGPQDQERGARQIEIFETILEHAARLGIKPAWIHLANSAAAMAIPNVPGNLVRTGIALYGQPPSRDVRDMLSLEPVMALIGRVTKVRRLRRGHGFPSHHFWIAPVDGWGAEVNLGYAHGYPRSAICSAARLCALRPEVLLHGQRCPLVGVIAHDKTYVFSREKPDIGDEVVFWGRQGQSVMHLYEIAAHIQALPYELPTWLSQRVARLFLNNRAALTLAA